MRARSAVAEEGPGMAASGARYDLVVYIGRFQCAHLGHLETIRRGLDLGERLLVLCGSEGEPRTLRNPFTIEERHGMLRASLAWALPGPMHGRVTMASCRDFAGDDGAWVDHIRAIVSSHVGAGVARVGLIGHFKDESSYYLGLFDGWGLVEMPCVGGINASDIRREYFGGREIRRFEGILPPPVMDFLVRFKGTIQYALLRAGEPHSG